MYTPAQPPTDPKQLAAFLQQELARISREFAAPTHQLQPQAAAPARPRDGLIVLADGTNWNPGSGAGYYGYRSGAWHLLG